MVLARSIAAASPRRRRLPAWPPARSTSCTGSYVLTQADIDAGQKDNTATAAGADENGNPVSDHGQPQRARCRRRRAIQLIKTGVLDDGGDGGW